MPFETLPPVLNDLIKSIGDVWGWTWWIVLPFFSFLFFWEAWVYYIQVRYLGNIKWKLLELKVPQNILQTPKSMEQIFAAAHAPYSYGLIWREKYWEGKSEDAMAFEMIGKSGEVRFYLRVPQQNRNLIEAAIYAQYPNVEIREAEEYITDVPEALPNKNYDITGADFALREPTCLPIRTYPLFEDPVEERRVDPISGIMEIMSKLTGEQRLWIQMIVRPAGDDWKEEGRKMINKIIGREEGKKKKQGFFESIFGLTAGEVLRAPFEHPSLEVKRKESGGGENFRLLLLSPGEKEMVEAIEHKIAKLGFETTYRVISIDRRETFSKAILMAVFGAIRQFHIQNLNSMRPDKTTTVLIKKGLFRLRKIEYRKRRMFERYRYISAIPHPPIMNTEELATLYHFPMGTVAAPHLQRIESKKGGAPPTLPVIEENEF